jgi:hypothetical protein
MGIIYAGDLPSNDPHVVAPLAVGFFMIICFASWETFGHLKQPLAPPRVFAAHNGRALTFPVIAVAVINMTYFSTSIVWPTMINVYYANPEDWRYGNLLSLPQGLGIMFGSLALSFLGNRIKHWNWQLTAMIIIMVVFGTLACCISTPSNMGMMIAFIFINNAAYGWAIYLAIAMAQLGVVQEELGVSGGITGTFRATGGVGMYQHY